MAEMERETGKVITPMHPMPPATNCYNPPEYWPWGWQEHQIKDYKKTTNKD